MKNPTTSSFYKAGDNIQPTRRPKRQLKHSSLLTSQEAENTPDINFTQAAGFDTEKRLLSPRTCSAA